MTPITRVFLSFAAEDADYRSLLLAASRAAGLPVRFVETTYRASDTGHRRALSRDQVRQCEAGVVIASAKAWSDTSVAADLAAVHEAGIPLHAIVAGKPSNSSEDLPTNWSPSTVTGWNWPSILELLQLQPAAALQPRRVG